MRLCATAWLAAAAALAEDVTIRPVSGSTSSPILFGAIADTIDGTIDAELFLGLGQVAGPFTGPYAVRYDLGHAFALSGMDFWNNAGEFAYDGEGVDLFELRFLDGKDQFLGTYTANAADSLSQQTFAFSASHVRRVDLVIISNHAPVIRGYALFHEINFRGHRERPVFTGVGGENGTVQLSVSNLAVGSICTVYRTPDLAEPDWSNLTEFVAQDLSTNIVTPNSGPGAFYSVGSK